MSNESGLTKALNDKDAEVSAILRSMEEAGASPFGLKLVEDSLRHIFRGILLARVQSIDPVEVEDGLVNIFTLGINEMCAGRYFSTMEEELDLAQRILHDAAALMAENIAGKWRDKAPSPTNVN